MIALWIGPQSWTSLLIYMLVGAILLAPVGIASVCASWFLVKKPPISMWRTLLIFAVASLAATIAVTIEMFIAHLASPGIFPDPVHASNIVPGMMVGGWVSFILPARARAESNAT